MRPALSLLLLTLGCEPGSVKIGDSIGETGGGGAPDIEVDPTSLDLGAAVGSEALSATFVVRNAGDADLSGAIAVDLGDAWYTVDTATLGLAAGAESVVTVGFSAADLGTYSGTVLITSDDPDEPSVEVALLATVDVDTDLDGAGDSEDCAPEDGTIYPGADEIWYDGVDQDCSGTSDYDQDGDGADATAYGGLDCDDLDSAVGPDADEIWYDGLDQDCDQRSDYDQDGDGYDASDYGGDDCDDGSASVGPGATEDPGNGADDDCDGKVDEDPTTSDDDRDGYTPAEGDCNDSDVSINPDATDTWYDGVDTDCDGLSDYDQDRDGYDSAAYGGDDCNDLDDAMSPGATDTWYDGLDSDCSGGSDYDQDGDGHEVSSAGGDDCDDTDGAAYPGASETWYDGTDSDCSGGSDYDQDGDGQTSSGYGGKDCDDTNADVYNGATEVCDGADNDCDGSTDEGVTSTYYADADGDGYGDASATVTGCEAPAGYSSDSSDCDDTDDTRNPDATEVAWSGVDEDCDDLIDNVNAEDEAGWTVHGTGTSDAVGSGGVYAFDDMNGDGDAELIICAPVANFGSGWSSNTDIGFLSLHDAATAGLDLDTTDGFMQIYGDSSYDYLGSTVAPLGDVDSDGYDEIFVGSYADRGGDDYSGSAYVVDLNLAGTFYEIGDADDQTVEGQSSNGYYGYAVASGDMDGDGGVDVAGGAPGESSAKGRVYVSLWDNGYYSGTDDYAVTSSSYSVTGVSNSDHLGYAVIFGDFGGDGYDDLVMCAPDDDDGGSSSGVCWMDKGSSAPSAAKSTVNTVDDAEIVGSASNDKLGAAPQSIAVGDLDADGVDDLAIGMPGYDGLSTDGGAVLIWSGTSLSGSETASTATWLVRGEGALGTSVKLADATGDGVDDLISGATTADSTGMVYVLAGGGASGTYDLPDDQAASWKGKSASDAFGASLGGLVDLDGDGVLDLTVAATANGDGATGGGKVYVLPVAP